MSSRFLLLSSLISFTRFGSLLKRGPALVAKKHRETSIPDADSQEEKFEAAFKNLHVHSTERRRTARVSLSVPLIVEGETDSKEKFSVKTLTQSVSGHGGLIALDIPVVVGQTLVLINETGGQKAECKVVSVRIGRKGKTYVGFEFEAPQNNFWHMTFTTPRAKPLRRVLPIRISA